MIFPCLKRFKMESFVKWSQAIAFAIVFAIASQKRPNATRVKARLVELLEELNEIFLILINAIIALTAPAVVSLIAGALGKRSNLTQVFSDIGVRDVVSCFGYLQRHVLKKNLLKYLGHIIPAQMFSFASASSAATLPVTMKCVSESGDVPESVANFVVSLGATINMDGDMEAIVCRFDHTFVQQASSRSTTHVSCPIAWRFSKIHLALNLIYIVTPEIENN